MVGFIGTSLQLQSIVTAQNKWLSYELLSRIHEWTVFYNFGRTE
jgi:hypothetical protein